MPVLIIAVIEVITMLSLGYGLGRLLGWSVMESIFLGGAMQATSTALVVQILRDMKKQDLLSSRLIIGISIVEDFAAVIIITVLSGLVTTGVADLGDVGSLLLRIVIFVIASLVFGTIAVPRIMRLIHRLQYRDILLITSLGICFALALLGRYLGLSVAAGAFLMGVIIGNSEHSEDILVTVTPIRDMFGAIYFVAMGMLINITQFTNFVGPALIVAGVFILGKILSNALATLVTGYDARTALHVGLGMPMMGEFSLAIAKIGLIRGAVMVPLYPIIATATVITSFITPYIVRSADAFVEWLSRITPRFLKVYITGFSDWLQALRRVSSRESKTGKRIKGLIRAVLIDLVIIAAVIGVGTFALQFTERIADQLHIGVEIVATILGLVIIIICLSPVVLMWRNVRLLVDEAIKYVLSRGTAGKVWNQEALRIVLRDSILIIFSVLILVWLIPFISRLLFFGSYTMTVPIVLLAVVVYMIVISVRRIHGQLRITFTRVVLGEEHVADLEATVPGDYYESRIRRGLHKVKNRLARLVRFR